MSTQESLSVVKSVLSAFQNGDIQGVFAGLAEDVEWFIPGPPDRIPFSGVRHGIGQVMEFFGVLNATVEFLKFEPREYYADGNTVVAVGQNHDRWRSTGREFFNDWACVFNVRDGKIIRVRMFEDTAAFVIAGEKA